MYVQFVPLHNFLLTALGKIEDLLVDMKMDVTRLPSELSKIPSVSRQLKMDETSTLTKMAQRGGVVPPSVIAQAPPNATVVVSGGNTTTADKHRTPVLTSTASSSSTVSLASNNQKLAIKKETSVVMQDGSSNKRKTDMTAASKANVPGNVAQFPLGYPASSRNATLIPVTGSSGLRLQTPEGLLVAGGMQYAALQTSKPSGSTSVNEHTSYTMNVPAYMEGSNQVYQAATVQLVPVSAGQQIVVWPSMMQQGGKTAPPQLTVVQGSQLLSMVDTVSKNTQGQSGAGSTGTGGTASIITID